MRVVRAASMAATSWSDMMATQAYGGKEDAEDMFHLQSRRPLVNAIPRGVQSGYMTNGWKYRVEFRSE